MYVTKHTCNRTHALGRTKKKALYYGMWKIELEAMLGLNAVCRRGSKEWGKNLIGQRRKSEKEKGSFVVRVSIRCLEVVLDKAILSRYS